MLGLTSALRVLIKATGLLFALPFERELTATRSRFSGQNWLPRARVLSRCLELKNGTFAESTSMRFAQLPHLHGVTAFASST